MKKSTTFGHSIHFDEERLAMEVEMVLLENEENQLQKKLIPESQLKVVNKKNRDLVWKLVAHSLYGIVVLKQTEDQLMIRLDPSCKGFYSEYFILELHKVDDEWSIVSHNLPHFMMLEMIVQKKSKGDAKKIIDDCDNYLRSYTYRKFQVFEAKECFPKLSFDCDSTYSFVAIRFRGFEKLTSVKATLRYGPYDELPVKIDFETEESQYSRHQQTEIKKMKLVFRKIFLTEALKTLETE